MEKKKIVESISHAEIRNVLLKHGIEWRHSKTVLGKSRDPVYDLKKRIEELKNNTHQKVQYFYFRMKNDQ
jgi:hypothetical protein